MLNNKPPQSPCQVKQNFELFPLLTREGVRGWAIRLGSLFLKNIDFI